MVEREDYNDDSWKKIELNKEKSQDYFVLKPGLNCGTIHFNNYAHAKNRDYLNYHQIGMVISLIRGQLEFELELSEMRIKHLQIPIDDDDQSNMLVYLDRTYCIIQDQISAGINVLVHCVSCVSRAPTFAVAFIIRQLKETKKLTWESSQKRYYNPIEFVNLRAAWQAVMQPNFLGQIALYWGRLYGCRGSVITMRKWLDSKLADYYCEHNQNQDYVDLCTKMIVDSAPLIYGDHQSRIKCQKCRELVVNSNDVSYLEDIQCFSVSVISDYIKPYLDNIHGQGVLECANCFYKLGHYNWNNPSKHKDEVFFPQTFDSKFQVTYKSTFHLNLNRIDFDSNLPQLFLTNLTPTTNSD